MSGFGFYLTKKNDHLISMGNFHLISKMMFFLIQDLINVLFLTSENTISRIIYSLFRERQTIFIIIFRTKFVVKCATKILKID